MAASSLAAATMTTIRGQMRFIRASVIIVIVMMCAI